MLRSLFGKFDEFVGVEDVVTDADHPAARQLQMATASHPERLGCGRPVERLGGGRAPVDEQPLARRRRQPDPADVIALAVTEIEPAEAEPVLDAAQLDQPALVLGGERVTLGTGRGGAARAHRPGLGQLPLGELAQTVEPAIHPVDLSLLGGDDGVSRLIRRELGLCGQGLAAGHHVQTSPIREQKKTTCQAMSFTAKRRAAGGR